MKYALTVLSVLTVVGLCGCSPEAYQAKGFRLPEGDIKKGQGAFLAMSCHTCHTVAGVDLPPAPSPGQHNVVLGGEVIKVKTYGELVTAVIHPAHDIAKDFDAPQVEGESSPMPQFNETMTVQQLIDIVAFLHSRYSERAVDYSKYGP